MKKAISTFAFLFFVSISQAQVTNQWLSHIPGNNTEEITSMAYTTDGNIIVSLQFQGSITIGNSIYVSGTGRKPCLIIKLNPAGELLWVKNVTPPGNPESAALKIYPEDNGGFSFVGYLTYIHKDFSTIEPSEAFPVRDLMIYEIYDKNGEHVFSSSNSWSDSYEQKFIDMDKDANGNQYMVGYLDKSIDDSNDNMMMMSFDSDNFLRDYFLIKPEGSNGRFKGITLYDEHLYMIGEFGGSADFDVSENKEVILNTPIGKVSSVVLKYTLDGDLVWAKHLSGDGSIKAESLVINEEGEIYIAGSFNGNIDFNPEQETVMLNGGIESSYVMKMDTDGLYDWSWTTEGSQIKHLVIADDNGVYFGGHGSTTFFGHLKPDSELEFLTELQYPDSPNGTNGALETMAYDKHNGLTIGVNFSDAFQYGVESEKILQSNGMTDFVVANYDVSSIVKARPDIIFSARQFPNPVMDDLHLEWDNNKVSQIYITDFQGNKILNKDVLDEVATDIPFPYQAGMYIVNFVGDGYTKSIKVIKL